MGIIARAQEFDSPPRFFVTPTSPNEGILLSDFET